LVAHFYRRAYNLLRAGGAFGLVGTKRVSEGDTREAGLKQICNLGGKIYSAQKRIRWPGGADVIVNAVHVGKEISSPKIVLDGREVPGINSFLFPDLTEFEASRLAANKGQAFRGCDIYGQGFLFCDEATSQHAGSIELMKSLLQERRSNTEVIFPYIGGQEVATHPKHLPHRFCNQFCRLAARKGRGLARVAVDSESEGKAGQRQVGWLLRCASPERTLVAIWNLYAGTLSRHCRHGPSVGHFTDYHTYLFRLSTLANGVQRKACDPTCPEGQQGACLIAVPRARNLGVDVGLQTRDWGYASL
jgi:hypothetical protein